jgi:hypothetical protein
VRFLITSAQFGTNLRSRYDLAVGERDHAVHIVAEVDRAG